MSHRDLPAERTAYDNFYDHDGAAENPFGQEALVECRPNAGLHAHLRAGHSILTFKSQPGEAAARARLSAAIDRALARAWVKAACGPAFPGAQPDYIDHPVHGYIERAAIGMEAEPGMSLRDYFAAAALAEVPDPTSIADAATTATLAYAIADAMLAERAKGAA